MNPSKQRLLWTLLCLSLITLISGCQKPQSASDILDKARQEKDADDYNAALNDFNKVIELEPGFGPAYDERASDEDELKQ